VKDTESKQKRIYRVFLLEDHEFMRGGLRAFLSIEPQLEICGEAERLEGATEAIFESKADVVILDIALPDGSGLEFTKDLRNAGFEGAILALTMHPESLYANRMLQAGANGYVTKSDKQELVLEALYEVLKGNTYVSNEWKVQQAKQGIQSDRTEKMEQAEQLTDRQIQILELMGAGLPTPKICERLNIKTATVNVQRMRMKERLGISDLSELTHFAVVLFGQNP
tara:strand:+ start:5512 stop:6186 length:675 start_codon:yes stop_codon:yes gene_type:complete